MRAVYFAAGRTNTIHTMVVTSTLLAGLFAVYIVRLFRDFSLPLGTRAPLNRPEWLFGALLLGLLLWQFSRIRNEEYNVDESTWIANALAVGSEPDLAHSLLNYTTARPLTVLPLLLISGLGLPISYGSIKVMSLLFIALTLLLTFATLRNLTTPRFALLFSFPLLVFYLTVQFDDFVAYNSELVCNVCVVAGVWLYSLIAQKRDWFWQTALVGFGLGLLPFIKFQAIPSGLVVGVLCWFALIRQQRIRESFVLIASGLMPLAVTAGYCLLTDQLTVLVRNYFLYYVNYSSQYSSQSMQERLSPRNIIYYYRRQYTFGAYWFGLIVAMGIGLWHSRRRSVRWPVETLFFIGLWAVSIYETIQAGTYYEHYLNLTLVPHTLLAAVLVYPVVKNEARPSLIPVGAFVSVALCITFFARTKPFERGYEPPLPYDAEVVNFIRRECRPPDRILIWGWADRYYVGSQIAPASGYVNSVFQMKPNGQQAYYVNQYLIDLQQHRPRLFLDAVAPQQFTYGDPRLYAHERFPAINQFITTNYRLVFERKGLRAYRLVPVLPGSRRL